MNIGFIWMEKMNQVSLEEDKGHKIFNMIYQKKQTIVLTTEI